MERLGTLLPGEPQNTPAPDDSEESGLFPGTLSFTKEQSFDSFTAKVTEHDTTPPKPHNKASLLSAMERVGNEETDPDAERRRLGAPATRAAVIKKLVKGGFVERKGKQLIPTKDGIDFVCVLLEALTSPKLTAEWENNLTQIARGKADPNAFMGGIEEMAKGPMKSYPFKVKQHQILPGLPEAYHEPAGCRVHEETPHPCYAVRAKTTLLYAVLREEKLSGKEFIPLPLKMPFYCVTIQFLHLRENRDAVAILICSLLGRQVK